MRFPLLFCSLLLLAIPRFGHCAAPQALQSPADSDAGKAVFDYDSALAISQGALNNQVGDYSFTNAAGERVSMADFRGKPLVISMIFTSCYQICPMTTRHLSKVVDKARDTLGEDSFEVAVIGFDTRVDTPDAMQYFANKQGISHKRWNLLSIGGEDIDVLSKDLGFIYYPSSNGFDHIIQATIIDADGKVYRQVYGQVFETPMLVDPLIELVLGRPKPAQSFLSTLSDKIKLFCTTYDPVRDGYYFDYSLFLGILIGGTIIVITIIILVRERRRSRQHSGA